MDEIQFPLRTVIKFNIFIYIYIYVIYMYVLYIYKIQHPLKITKVNKSNPERTASANEFDWRDP